MKEGDIGITGGGKDGREDKVKGKEMTGKRRIKWGQYYKTGRVRNRYRQKIQEVEL